MSFFVAPSASALDAVTDRMREDPAFSDRYLALRELQDASRQGLAPSVGEVARANGSFRVASLQGPLETLAQVLDPDWLREKNRFYRWLNKPPQHVTYDRRMNARPSPNSVTFVDGKEV